MTVKEFIEELKQYPENASVMINIPELEFYVDAEIKYQEKWNEVTIF